MANEIDLPTLAADLASLFGWTVKKPSDDGYGTGSWYIQIQGPDNASLGLSLNSREGKIHISGVFADRDAAGKQFWYVPYGRTNPSINVSATKSASQIAKDIERRLLPEYLELLSLMNLAWADISEHRGAVATAAEKVAKLLGAKVDHQYPDRPVVRLYHSTAFPEQSGDLQFSNPDSVVIDIGVTPAEALAMFKALIDFRKDSK